MRHVSYIVAAAALAGALAGCQDPYYSRYGNSQGYAPSYPANYSSYPGQSGYYPTRYGYGSTGDYYRNYNGIHSGPQVTFTYP
jgi:hypothetical protein